jgi:hypothetical protein
MRARMRGLAAALLCAGLMPGTADAATLVNDGGRLTYTGEPGEQNTIEFEPTAGGVHVGPMKGSVSGCTVARDTIFTCTGVSLITADLGDGDDLVFADGLWQSFLNGGPGDDNLVVFSPGYGSVLTGGPGIDTATFATRDGRPIAVTLDGVPNDGVPGAGIDVAPDVENVAASSSGPVSLTGDAGANELSAGDGDDTVTGGPGSDMLFGRDGDDTLDARDGETDRVECGNGTDTALVDPFDQVSESCERVQVAQVAGVRDDQPPRLAFKSGSALEVTADDDGGIVSVRFSAGETTLCTDTTAPYTCDFRPGVNDVGRKTIVAVAVDAAGQTATAVRTIVVPRFKPKSVALTVTRQSRRVVATGRVRLPEGIPCSGEVAIQAGKTTRKGKLTRICTFRIALPPTGRRFVATYLGTTAIEPKRSVARTAP